MPEDEKTVDPTSEQGTIESNETEPGTTAEATSEESVQSTETDEQVAARDVAYQTKYRESLERLDAADSTGHLKRIATGKAEPTDPSSEAAAPPATADQEPQYVGEMTKADLLDAIGGVVDTRVQASRNQSDYQAHYAENWKTARKEMLQFNKEHSINKDQAAALEDEMRGDGLIMLHEQEGGRYGTMLPTNYVKQYIKASQLLGRTRNKAAQTEAAKAAQAAKIEAAKQVSQPTGGSLSEPRNLSEDRKFLERVKAAKGNRSSIDDWPD